MRLRQSNVQKLAEGPYDVLVVGGGINGAVAAAALSARGVRVALIDRGDFAGETSQSSSNLIWGGIKYLEAGELGLVYQLCRARNQLIQSYPLSIREIRFFTCIGNGFRRSPFVVFAGALLYWLLGSTFTRKPRLLSNRDIAREEPHVQAKLMAGGLEYSDAILKDNDARFVFGFVRAALDRGAVVANYVEALRTERLAGLWQCPVTDVRSGQTLLIRAKVVINACGPWADAFNRQGAIKTRHRHLFSKGVHLIVDRITPNDHIIAFFADDGRLFFVIPMGQRSSIGTTDTRVDQLPAVVTDEDRRFILDNVNKRLRLAQPLTEADIIAERCGVRPLVVASTGDRHENAEWTTLSRKHEIEVDEAQGRVTVFGGKLTDCVNIGEELCDIAQRLGIELKQPIASWYGEPSADRRRAFEKEARKVGLDSGATASEPLSKRYWRRYGEGAFELLGAVKDDHAAATAIVAGDFTHCELDYAAKHEMVTTLGDLLRRRTTLALTERHNALAEVPELKAACQILFGEAAEQRYAEYFDEPAQG